MTTEEASTVQLLKQMKDATGLGLLECKNAIEKANGDSTVAVISLVGNDEARMIRIVEDKNSPTWILEALVSLNNTRVMFELSRSQNAKRLTSSEAIAITNKFSQQKKESDLKASNDKNARDLQNQVNALEKEVKQIKKAYNELLKSLDKRDQEISEALSKSGSRQNQNRTSYSYFAIGDFFN